MCVRYRLPLHDDEPFVKNKRKHVRPTALAHWLNEGLLLDGAIGST